MSKRVSVILVNYNGMPYLEACVRSILHQTYSDFEVVFVDNNSSDGSLEYARREFPEMVFVANDENLGYAGGINAGLAYATGEYISPLNMDTEVSPNLLSVMSGFLDANPRAGLVMPKILLYDHRSRINTMGSNIHVTGLSFCRGLNKADDGSAVPRPVPGVSGCSYMIRREILEAMGGAPEESFMGNDDVIVSWLANLMGFDCYCLPEAAVYHRYRLSMNPRKFFDLEKNRHALLVYTYKPTTLVILSPIIALVELLVLAYSVLKGRDYLRAKFQAWRALCERRSHLRDRRRQVQDLRAISDCQLIRKLRWNLEWRQLMQISR